MFRRYVWNSVCRDIQYRCKKIYHSFYYAQSHIKYVMVFLFPAIMWTTRYKTDTKLGYFVYINDEELYPNYSNNLINTKWKNGTKFYVDDNITVKEMKQKIYENQPLPDNLKVGCKGRMMEDDDNLAMAVRAFCKRDPKVILWRDEHAQFV